MYPQITVGNVTVQALTSSARNIRRATRQARKGYTQHLATAAGLFSVPFNVNAAIDAAESTFADFAKSQDLVDTRGMTPTFDTTQGTRPAYKFTAPKTLANFNQQLADAGVNAQLVKYTSTFELSLWGKVYDSWPITSFNHRTGTEWRQTLEAVYANAR